MLIVFTSHDDKQIEIIEKWFYKICFKDYLICHWETFYIDYTIDLDICFNGEMSVAANGKKIKLFDKENIFWYKRFSLDWGVPTNLKKTNLGSFYESEIISLNNYIHKKIFERSRTINSPLNPNFNKLQQLELASKAGFNIPQTLIANNSRKIFSTFLETPIITKAINNLPTLKEDNQMYVGYTRTLSEDELSAAKNELFFPSLVQQQIIKKVEYRIFFLLGNIFWLGILSQNSDDTKVDFRASNYSEELNLVNIIPSKELKEISTKLISDLNFDSGSMDIVEDIEGNFYFLEINEYGQSGMLNAGGCVNIEKEIAKIMKNECEKK